MKSIIIEDELPAARRLKRLLEENETSIEVLDVLDSIQSTVKWFKNNEAPDLVFMDIHLADGYSFEIFNQINLDVPIIFTTAYDEYALKAFEVNSIDYLLKPIDEKKLERSISKLNKWNQSKEGLKDLEKLFKKFKEDKSYKSRFLIKQPEKLLTIDENQVAYFMATQKIVLLVTHENRSFPVDQTLEELEQVLNPYKFFRINRKFLANLHAIKNIYNYFHGKLKIELSPPVKQDNFVSREKAPVFKKWLGGEIEP